MLQRGALSLGLLLLLGTKRKVESSAYFQEVRTKFRPIVITGDKEESRIFCIFSGSAH